MTVEAYTTYKPLLFGTAYRMLGSVSDAEDIVHDVFMHYMQLDTSRVLNERAYLTKMTVNRCLNLLKSTRHQREIYTGPWLPEPLADEDYHAIVDPAVRRENISYAFLVLMDKLTPLERAIYILRQALQYEYRTIADMLDKNERSVRKTFSRAKGKVEQDCLSDSPDRSEEQERFVEAFIQAVDRGEFDTLHHFLMEDVTLISDGGGKARTALRPILGIARLRAFFNGLSAKGRFQEGFARIDLNGEPGLMLRQDGRIDMVVVAEWGLQAPGIQNLYLITNPDKLARLNRDNPDTSRL